MSFHVNNKVRLLRDIYRLSEEEPYEEILYATEGETGVIIEIFKTTGHGPDISKLSWILNKKVNAKVKMDDSGKIKTFRITSLERIKD